MKTLILTLACMAATLTAAAQQSSDSMPEVATTTDSVAEAYIDSLAAYKAQNQRLKAQLAADARFFRLFAPLTYYYSVTKSRLRFDADDHDLDGVNTEIDRILMDMYLTRPDLVAASDDDLEQIAVVQEQPEAPIHSKATFTEAAPVVLEEQVTAPLDIVVEKPNFWTYSGDYYVQFLQNYISSNWYKGGESNYSMVASATLQANYNNKSKVKWDNKLELKLGFQTSRSDSLHSLKTSEDLMRYTSSLGLQATKNWYYTVQLIAYTQFMRGFKSNDEKTYSDIMSPFNSSLAIGMSYTVSTFNKKLTGTINIAPLAGNFRYVDRKDLLSSYSIESGHTLVDYGSSTTWSLVWKFTDNLKWTTRFYAYTTYSRTEIEWENTLAIQFSMYFSSN